jgi:phosphatidylglycerol:prolipoprotein diacylglycerol transferase
MHPELNFGPFTITAYSFFTAAALLVAVIGGYFFARRRGLKRNDSLWMLLGMGLSVFIGARLFNVIINLDWYAQEPARAVALTATGLSLYGGVVFGALAGAGIARARRIPLLKFADTVAPFVGIGIALMRVGCFLNGCCFGKVTDLPWGVKFPPYSLAHMHQISENPFTAFSVQPVHPTQLYELAAALLCTLLAFILIKKKTPHGTAALACVILFSVFRLINMQLRALTYSDTTLNIWYPLFYAAIIAVSGIYLFKLIKK